MRHFAAALIESANLDLHAGPDRPAGWVIRCAVDPKSRADMTHVPGHRKIVPVQCVQDHERLTIGINHRHSKTSL